MSVISQFESLVEKLEKLRGPFNLFALVLTRKMEGVISTSGDVVPVSHNRWAVVAAAPWLGAGRLTDVRKLTDAIRHIDEGPLLLQNYISRIVVIPPHSESIRFLAERSGGSPETVLTRSVLFGEEILQQDDRLATLFSDVLRARVLRANPVDATTPPG
jgi:hypothetical protein